MKSYLILLSLIVLALGSFAIQKSFADQASGKPAWEVGSDKVCGDRLCSEESFASIPPLHPDTFRIMITDSEGNALINPELNKEHLIVFYKVGSDSQESTYEVTTSIECGTYRQLIYNETKSITLPPFTAQTVIGSFIPTMAGPHFVTLLSENWPPITLYFSIPAKLKNHCDYGFINDLTPLKQYMNGIPSGDVLCNEGLALIFKSTDGSPACVKSKTAQKLIERGWAS